MIEVTLDIDKISKRDEYIDSPTGTLLKVVLTLNYREVDAVALVANYMGMLGYKYEKDWHWEDAGCDELTVKVDSEDIATQLKLRW